MPFTNVIELRAEILNWLARTPDDEDAVVNAVNGFITLAESRIARTVRVREMQERVKVPMNEAQESLPAFFVEPIACNLQSTTGAWRPLQWISENELNRYWRYEGKPLHYTITGGQLRFGPYVLYDETATSAPPNVELLFFAAPRPLGEATPTNDILKKYPDLYLYGSLIEAGGFILSDQIELYGDLWQKAMDAANLSGIDAMYEGPQRATAAVNVA